MRADFRIAALVVAPATWAGCRSPARLRAAGVVRTLWSPALGRGVRTLVYLPSAFDPNGPAAVWRAQMASELLWIGRQFRRAASRYRGRSQVGRMDSPEAAR